MPDKPPLVAVVGPTGSGKSDLALALAETFNGEIVNCDSVQLYRHLDIGTAKTPPEQRRGIRHHLIDILDPNEHFTAGDYARVARTAIHDIAARGKLPVVVGGTGFYLRALLEGLFTGPSRDEALRARLTRRRPGSLHRLLSRFDPVAAARIHPNDTNKLVRAVEVCLIARRPITVLFRERESRGLEGFRVYKVGLNPPRHELAERINQRCLSMFRSGLVDEVRNILSMGYTEDTKALTSIGYREALLHIRGQLSYDEAILRTQAATRQYAKRQRTWFFRDRTILWASGFGNSGTVARDTIHHLRVGINYI